MKYPLPTTPYFYLCGRKIQELKAVQEAGHVSAGIEPDNLAALQQLRYSSPNVMTKYPIPTASCFIYKQTTKTGVKCKKGLFSALPYWATSPCFIVFSGDDGIRTRDTSVWNEGTLFYDTRLLGVGSTLISNFKAWSQSPAASCGYGAPQPIVWLA